jgi:hypothetical protein
MRRRTTTALAVLAAGAILSCTAACSTRADSDMIVLYYKSGVGDNRVFSECVQPGKSGAYPIDDQIFALPTSLRTWNIRPSGGDSKDPIKSGSKPTGAQPGPEVVVYTATDFYLNTNCDDGKESPIVQFWEKTGRRYHVSKDGENGFDPKAWETMLVNTLVTAQETALRARTRDWTAEQLDANLEDSWNRMEQRIAAGFADELRAKLGGDYFCGPEYQSGKTVTWDEPVLNEDGTISQVKRSGTCPPVRVSITDINLADPGIVEARNKVYKAQQEAEAELIKARAEVEKARLLDQAARNSAYVELRKIEAQLEAARACAGNPNCTLVIGADGVIAK